MKNLTAKRILAISLASMMAIGSYAPVFAEEEETAEEATEESGDSVEGALEGVKVKFGTTALFAPFTYYDEDGETLIGFDLELMNALKDYLGFELDGDIEVADYSALTTSLAEGKTDMGMAALCATDERKQVMTFSNTYRDSGQVVMINTETSPEEITDIDTLVDGDYKIAVEKGTGSHLYLTNAGVSEDRLEVHDTITTAYESLEQGKVDALLQDGPNAYYYTKTTDGTKLEVVGDEFNQGQAPYAIAFSNDFVEANEGIVDIFNQAIDDLNEDGTIPDLVEEWLE